MSGCHENTTSSNSMFSHKWSGTDAKQTCMNSVMTGLCTVRYHWWEFGHFLKGEIGCGMQRINKSS